MKAKSVVALTMTFALGTAAGVFASKKGVDPSTYLGKSPKEAAAALLAVAKTQAGKGSWENIAIGRVYYLGGMKQEGQAIFDQVTRKPEEGDWIRIARVYSEAGEWNKARDAFDKAIASSKNDAPWLAEVGAYYNLSGDRAKAEEMFAKSFAIESTDAWATVNMAGSYLGVPPR